MRIVLNGKKVGKRYIAWYLENQACFKKEGLKKRTVLHELYHHLVDSKGVELSIKTEEKEANRYASFCKGSVPLILAKNTIEESLAKDTNYLKVNYFSVKGRIC